MDLKDKVIEEQKGKLAEKIAKLEGVIEQKDKQIKNLRGKLNLQKMAFPVLQAVPIVGLRRFTNMAPIR